MTMWKQCDDGLGVSGSDEPKMNYLQLLSALQSFVVTLQSFSSLFICTTTTLPFWSAHSVFFREKAVKKATEQYMLSSK